MGTCPNKSLEWGCTKVMGPAAVYAMLKIGNWSRGGADGNDFGVGSGMWKAMTWTCPRSAAQCSGEQPSPSRTSEAIPRCSSSRTASASPLAAALCSSVCPCCRKTSQVRSGNSSCFPALEAVPAVLRSMARRVRARLPRRRTCLARLQAVLFASEGAEHGAAQCSATPGICMLDSGSAKHNLESSNASFRLWPEKRVQKRTAMLRVGFWVR